MTEPKEMRIVFTEKDLAGCTDENLFILLEDLQNATADLFKEGWKRGIHTQLASKAMENKQDSAL